MALPSRCFEIIEVETALSDSVSKFKNKVHEKEAQWEPDRQRLFIGSVELGDRRVRVEDETKTLGEYGVERLSALTLEPQDPAKAKGMSRRTFSPPTSANSYLMSGGGFCGGGGRGRCVLRPSRPCFLNRRPTYLYFSLAHSLTHSLTRSLTH